MKLLVTILGYFVVFGYLFKIFFIMYLRNKNGDDLGFGPDNTLSKDYFKSIKSDVGPRFELLKRFFNSLNILIVIYLVLMMVYLIGFKNH